MATDLFLEMAELPATGSLGTGQLDTRDLLVAGVPISISSKYLYLYLELSVSTTSPQLRWQQGVLRKSIYSSMLNFLLNCRLYQRRTDSSPLVFTRWHLEAQKNSMTLQDVQYVLKCLTMTTTFLDSCPVHIPSV